jgi:hypothetical protein
MLTTKSFYGRTRKRLLKSDAASPKQIKSALHSSKAKTSLFPIMDILCKKEQNSKTLVLVQWQNTQTPNTWLDLDKEDKLKEYLYYNKANPYSCTLIKETLTPFLASLEPPEIQALKQTIFDHLGGSGATPKGSRGKSRRLSVTLPFSKMTWDSTFAKHSWPKIDTSDDGNKAFHTSVDSLSPILGDNWGCRFLKTSTTNEVDPNYPVYITWEYKSRTQYNHTSCARWVY